MPVVICVQDFNFMGGSLGLAAGEAIIAAFELAVKKQTPLVMFAASGGARHCGPPDARQETAWLP